MAQAVQDDSQINSGATLKDHATYPKETGKQRSELTRTLERGAKNAPLSVALLGRRFNEKYKKNGLSVPRKCFVLYFYNPGSGRCRRQNVLHDCQHLVRKAGSDGVDKLR